MAIDRGRARQCLKSFDFRRLFLDQLGWDKHTGLLEKTVDGRIHRFQAVSEKRGVVVLVADSIPEYSTRVRLDELIAKDHFEHLIIFTDQSRGRQVWQWMRTESGKPNAIRAYTYSTGQTGELLLQKLEHLVVTLEDEEQTGLADILGRIRTGFDVEKVTKKFYERFKAEHERFLKFIDGIPDKQMESWYASVMINRLMFLYFIQAKSFLNADLDYLRNKLKESRDRKKDGYYRNFLCPLFFEGFARKREERSPAVNKLLGNVPYLNGGLFQKHQIEELHGKKVQIADTAFEHLFNFFKEYNWHLDERENRDDREINPDVLGYIFEKYINQKQMGAYYTKEDITEYISKNTIIPFLLDAARKDCSVAFDKTAGVWRLLRDDPDRYIYSAVRHGINLELPAQIAAGLSSVGQRTGWNKQAPSEFALPTEIWREVVERRRRYQEVYARLAGGSVTEVNDLITLNLDIRQFAQDVIQFCEGPELLRALYKAIAKVSVLDPTCGSGAFLFAALNILKPLYEACLQRMQMFVDELEAGSPHHPKKFQDFRQILEESKQHPKQDYFILKSIIVNNLYGVDIMEEAVEICKLRLFLKLVAQVDSQDRIEPLPDIDFNIRAGNTLVGYARYSDAQKAVGSKFDFEDSMGRIEDKAKRLDAAVAQFRLQQTRLDGAVTVEDKAALRERFAELDDELNDFLAAEYGVKKVALREWQQSHKPFHWFSHFHRIMNGGGFDVVIGNPPYVVFPSDKVAYGFPDGMYEVLSSKNLYALTFERALALSGSSAYVSLIVQLTAISSERMRSLQDLLLRRGTLTAVSFPRRPESVFDGVEMPVVILHSSPSGSGIVSTRVNRFYTQGRLTAVFTLSLGAHNVRIDGCRLAKLGDARQVALCQEILGTTTLLGALIVSNSKHQIYYQEACRYWVKATFGLPYFRRNHECMAPPHGRILCFQSDKSAALGACLLNSTIFWWLYSVFCDCEHINDGFVRRFPVPASWNDTDWVVLGKELTASLAANANRKTIRTTQGHTIEYDEIKASHSKAIIDRIDFELGRHFGLSGDQIDFIANYDSKYRLGTGVDEE
ncbi:MAG: Eco57I restriction-modification methylase domain-containing protein [Bryobacterales bacterium]|nr:Eco57I restriction-modification methylase domain-containing protein [Bryobacterales bacterium]MCZ2156477.1 Eco57I restriction-modification methylase domain-containing protein [Bryobacterales bacterium]